MAAVKAAGQRKSRQKEGAADRIDDRGRGGGGSKVQEGQALHLPGGRGVDLPHPAGLQGLPIDPVVAADVSQGIYLHPAVFIWGTFFRIDLTHVLLVFLCHLFCRP